MRKLKIVIAAFLLFWTGLLYSQSIIEAEYFFDADPGYGNGIEYPIISQDSIDEVFDIPANTLSAGFHTLHLRFRNDSSGWGLCHSAMFFIEPETAIFPSSSLNNFVYFFDDDPGTGNGTLIHINSTDSIDFIENISTSGLTAGFHTLHIRTINDSSVSGLYSSEKIYIYPVSSSWPQAKLSEAEYFFDVDPGTGFGIPLNIQNKDSVETISFIPVGGLTPGFHTIFIRIRNDSALWSLYQYAKIFVDPDKEPFPNASFLKAEYYFDTDPGFGYGTTINIAPDDSVDMITEIPLDTLSVGFHDLFIRICNDSLKWSLYNYSHFFLEPDQTVLQLSSPLVEAEYFYDNDPGLGNGITLTIPQGDSLNMIFEADYSGIDTGYHFLYARVMNSDSVWSLYKKDTLLIRDCDYPVANFFTSDGCYGDTTFFTDLSSNVDSTAIYEWDINNDGTTDYFTVGNIAHLYTMPGTYDVKLSVWNSGVCLDIMIKQVTISAPQPDLGNDTSICDCASIILNAGNGFNTYLWSNGDNTQITEVMPVLPTTYTVTVTDNLGCEGSDYIFVNTYECPGFTLNTGVLLQGAYAGSGMMDTQLQQYLPLTQPYNSTPWNYTGTENLMSIPVNMVDWILVEVRSGNDFTRILDRRAGVLLNDGTIVDTNLTSGLSFYCIDTGSYYIVLSHRNHLPVMNANPVSMPFTDTLDFKDVITNPPYGPLQEALFEMEQGYWGMISGDINQNYQLKYSGPDNDRGLVLQKIVNVSGSSSITTTIDGYYNEDINMDGTVKYSGPGNDPSIIIQNLVTITGSTSITSVFITPVPPGSP